MKPPTGMDGDGICPGQWMPPDFLFDSGDRLVYLMEEGE
jgi:hypothetical protein